MSQIVKRKKKGRPPKSDLERQQAETDLRRSLRRRNVKYVFDLDDYFDDDDELFNDEDRRRREKKLKLLLKLDADTSVAGTPPSRRVEHASAASASSSEKPRKKRKVYEDVDDYLEDDDMEEGRNDNGNNWDCEEEDDEEVEERKAELRTEDSPLGTPANNQSGLPLPDKKALEFILDKLQKKDIYGVYAEPVDPEELPDYHDIIEHPMDFATVRNNLRNGSYVTLEQLESDVFLICSNAMQYNSPDTVYYKQARTIRELAEKKFNKIRVKYHARSGKEVIKPEQKIRSVPILKKQMKRSVNRTVQEPVGSDFSYGATLAAGGDTQNVINTHQAQGLEKFGGIDGSVEGTSTLNGNIIDKTEESQQGKGMASRFGRRSSIQDENRRATYNTSLDLPESTSESIFTTFEGEAKQLVPVGLYSDHSYSRSLARFAATLGPVAWKVASKRIEQALPQGVKFDRGWVGEYEPLPTSAVILENHTINEPPFFAKPKPVPEAKKCENISHFSVSPNEIPGLVLEPRLPFLSHAGIRPPPASFITSSFPNKDHPVRAHSSEVKATPFFLSPGNTNGPIHPPNLIYRHQNMQPRIIEESDKKSLKLVELSGGALSDSKNEPDPITSNSRHISLKSNVESPRPTNFSPRNANFPQFGPLKQPHNHGTAFEGFTKAASNRGGGSNTTHSSSSDTTQKPATSYHPRDQIGLTDPVQLMKMMAEKGQNQHQTSQNPSLVHHTPQFLQSAPFLSSNGTLQNNAAMAAARAWMSVGQAGFGPATENTNVRPQTSRFRGEFPTHVQPDKNSSGLHVFVPQGPMPMIIGNEIQFQNPQMVFPPADLSGFQVQQPTTNPWRNMSPSFHSRQRQESLPPDLNISFQSSGSPGKPSPGVLVDSQQPDLALQL